MMMGCLSYLTTTTTTTTILSSLHNNNSASSSGLPRPHLPNTKINSNKLNGVHTIKSNGQQSTEPKKKSQPSVTEVERAIGAGMFKDRDPLSSSTAEKQTMFDMLLNIPQNETAVEKKLRKAGEWILDNTESPAAQSAGQQILVVVCLWILPMWLLMLSVASGLIKLPFSTPALDDLIM